MEDILEEIGLCGLEGCTIDELWDHLESRNPPFLIPCHTQSARDYLWKQILKCTTILTIYKTPQPKPIPKPFAKYYLPDESIWEEYLPVYQYNAVTSDSGSCLYYNERINITNEILSLSENEQTIDNINKRYGERCICVVGDQFCRQKSLIPSHFNPLLISELTTVKYNLLEAVGMSRRRGMFRNILTNKYLNIDPRSTFHFVKTLSQLGLISVKVFSLKPVKGGPTSNIHIVFLKCFEPTQSLEQSNEILMSDLLLESPDKTLPMCELKRIMGSKMCTKVCTSLLADGYVKLIERKEQDNDYKMVQLIKPFAATTEEGEEREEEEEERGGTISPVLELPLDIQGFRLIDDCGPNGITMSDFTKNGFMLNTYLCRAVANSLVKRSCVSTFLQDDKKVRVLNLISNRHLQSNKNIEEFKTEFAKAKSKTTPSSLATPLRIGADFHVPVKRQNVPYAKKLKIDESIDKEESQVEESPRKEIEQSIVTFKQVKRLNLIMNFVQEKKIFAGTIDVIKYLREQEKLNPDRKTVLRLLDMLIDGNNLYKRKIQLTKPTVIYYLPNVSQDEQDKFISTLSSKPYLKQIPKQPKEKEEEKNEQVTSKTILIPSKFQKLKHFHFYLWILLNHHKISSNLTSTLSVVSFPWLQGMLHVPIIEQLRFSDILYHMPLSLLIILNHKIGQKLVHECNNNLPLHSLSLKLQKRVSLHNQEQLTVIELLKLMKQINILTVSGSLKSVKEADSAIISLNYDLHILDTSKASPRSSFFTNEAKSLFNSLTHSITSLTDLQNYWYTLQHICLTTPIIISSRRRKTDLSLDEYSLPYSTAKISRSNYDSFNERGFGAGGLPPTIFSHISKNWTISHDTKTEQDVSCTGKSVPPRSGGKGHKRHRVKKVIQKAHKMRLKLKEKSQNVTLVSLIPIHKQEGISNEDIIAASLRTGERSVWYPHEDNFLLLSYMSTLVLHRLGHPPTSQTVLRNALHNQFKTSRDKTVSALHRRLRRLLKVYSQDSLDVCVNEVVQSVTESCAEQTFHFILEFILQHYISHNGHIINISLKSNDQILIPLTVQERESIIEYQPKEVIDSYDSLTEQQILLLSVILMSASPDSVDSYTIYKLIEQFSETDIRAAMNCLKSQSYVVSTRTIGTRTLYGSLENKGLLLGTSLHSLFEGAFSKELFTEIKEMKIKNDIVIEAESVTGGQVASFINELMNPTLQLFCEPYFPSPLLITQSCEEEEEESSNIVQSIMMEQEMGEEEIGEEEIGDEESGEEEQGGKEAIKQPRAGVSTLLDINESSLLQHGTIHYRPSITNRLSLLDPPEEYTNDYTTTTTATVVDSFDSFLQYASSTYPPTVTMTTLQRIYTTIIDSQARGVTMATLLESCPDDSQLTIILQDLINFQLIYCVGMTTPLYISHAHHHLFYCKLNESEVAPIRPWVQREEEESIIVKEYAHGVLMYIITNPGVTLTQLYDRFKYILQLVNLEIILQMLLISGCVMKYTLVSKTSSLPFASGNTSFVKSCHDNDAPSSICYEATITAESSFGNNL